MNNQTNGYDYSAATFGSEAAVNADDDYERVTVVLPPVWLQDGPTCVFNAIAYMVESQNKGLVVEVKSFFEDYLQKVNVSFGQDDNRVITALEMFKAQGVIASICGGLDKKVHIFGYECSQMTSPKVFSKLESGTPLLGTFPVQDGFHTLGDKIFEVNPDEPAALATHIVMFVGYGERKGRPYLVFLNSYGLDWGTWGLGRVYFDQVYQLEYDEGFQFIMLTVDNGMGISLAVAVPPSPDDKPLFLSSKYQVETYPAGHSYSSFPYDEAFTFDGLGVYPDAFATTKDDQLMELYIQLISGESFGASGCTLRQTPYKQKMQILKNKAATFASGV